MTMLTFDPTPLYLLETDGRGNHWYIKREDLLPYCFGGNKARIGLEYLRDMQAKGCNHMVAYGNARSNLCRVLSNLCAGAGVPLTILTPADDDGQQRPSFNGKLCKALGARVVPCLKTAVAEAVDQTLAQIRAAGDKPYYIYGDRLGRGNEATPTRAYVPVWGEILTQCGAQGFTPDLISLAVGTGMTQAGLLCGRELAGGGPEVLGVSIARDKAGVQAHVADYANAWFADKGLTDSITPENVRVCDAYRQSYGVYDETVAESLHHMFAVYGLPLDGTYVGKALCGLKRLSLDENWTNRKIVFIHTGGTPLFFDAVQGW